MPSRFVKVEVFGADEAFLSNWVPNSRSVADNTFIVGIEQRCSWRALALEGLVVEDEASRASDAGQSVGVPYGGSSAGDAEAGTVDIGESNWADAEFLSGIIDLVGGA